MSAYSKAPPSYSPTFPPSSFILAAHTASATALTEKLFHGRISQKDYDAQIIPTSIMSVTRVANIPIIMTIDDSLTAILALAVRGLDSSSANKESAKLYLWCPTEVLENIGIPIPVSSESVLLDQDGLKKLFKFMKEGDRNEQLLLAYEGDIAEAHHYKKLMTRDENREDDTDAMMDWRPTSSSSEGRRRRELWTEAERRRQDITQEYHGYVALRSTREFNRANEQHNREREVSRAEEREGHERR